MTLFKLSAIALIAATATACVPVHKNPGQHPAPDQPAPPSMNMTLKTNDRGDLVRLFSTMNASQKAGKVRVCIVNSSSGRNKGLHFKSAGSPKYVVRKRNDVSCGHYTPGKKTFYLWRNTPLGKWKLRRTLRLDLSRFAGQQITFDWVRD